jgi:hypothetical protein
MKKKQWLAIGLVLVLVLGVLAAAAVQRSLPVAARKETGKEKPGS